MTEHKWLEKWKVISLLELVKEIGGGEAGRDSKNKYAYQNHPVYKEWEYCVQERAKGNDRGFLEWLDNENIPIITAYLIERGWKKEDNVMFWVCW